MKRPDVAGSLCLDFVNTVDPRHAPQREERLPDYAAVRDWARQAGIEAAPVPAAAASRMHEEAIALRETLYAIFGAVARGETPPEEALRHLNDEIARRPRRITERFAWAPADDVLAPIVWSAAELLTSGPLERMRECPGDDTCGWLFLDTSRNGSRRWCDMRTCGNRAKARRFYRRSVGASRSSESVDRSFQTDVRETRTS
jgi:predicted RNA-binding Zn ribbon-like protein